jgi:hypothetical protein
MSGDRRDFGQEEYFAEHGRAQFGPGLSRSNGRRRGSPAQPPPPSGTPAPEESPTAWDQLSMAGVLFLGLAMPDGHTGNKVDVKKHGGRDGGRVTDKGAEAAEFQIHFRFWNKLTWQSWDQLFALINPQRPVEQRGPVDVFHPALEQRGINRVYVKSVTFPKRQANGEWQATATVIQWLQSAADRQGRSVTRTRTGAGNVASNGTAFEGLDGESQQQQEGLPGIASGLITETDPDDPADTETDP